MSHVTDMNEDVRAHHMEKGRHVQAPLRVLQRQKTLDERSQRKMSPDSGFLRFRFKLERDSKSVHDLCRNL